MSKLAVVDGDPVSGTDKHNVSGTASGSPPPPYAGMGDYDYVGSMTDALVDFVKIDGSKVANVSSKSSLDPGESAPPTGKHSGPMGSNFVPAAPAPNKPTLTITDVVGTGVPGATAGSTFVKAGGAALLLDGDKVDTCDGLSIPMNSSVTADGQAFVSCSE